MGLQRTTVKLTGRLQKLPLVFFWNPKGGRAEGMIENLEEEMGPVPTDTSLRRFRFVVSTAIVAYGLNLRGASFHHAQ